VFALHFCALPWLSSCFGPPHPNFPAPPFREREWESIDGLLLRNSCLLLLEVNLLNPSLYISEFENELLLQTRRFYAAESQRCIGANSVPDYLRAVEERLQEEESRAERYFAQETKAKIRGICQEGQWERKVKRTKCYLNDVLSWKAIVIALILPCCNFVFPIHFLRLVFAELLVRYAARLVSDPSSGAAAMFSSMALGDMTRMYDLFSREPSTLGGLKDCMANMIQTAGSAIIAEKVSPRLFVEKILALRSHYLRFVEGPFRGDRNFARALKDSLEYVINIDPRVAQYLSLYTDDLLRKQSGSSSSGSAAGSSAATSSSGAATSGGSGALSEQVCETNSTTMGLWVPKDFEQFFFDAWSAHVE
jgi:cullin 3